MRVIFEKEYFHRKHRFTTISACVIGIAMFLEVIVSATIIFLFPEHFDRIIVSMIAIIIFGIFSVGESFLIVVFIESYLEQKFDFHAKFEYLAEIFHSCNESYDKIFSGTDEIVFHLAYANRDVTLPREVNFAMSGNGRKTFVEKFECWKDLEILISRPHAFVEKFEKEICWINEANNLRKRIEV